MSGQPVPNIRVPLTVDGKLCAHQWWDWFHTLPGNGINATVTLAKLTVGGANGSITFTGGIATAYTAPT
jgi:hypothetical protein